jgi:hypothetical protein
MPVLCWAPQGRDLFAGQTRQRLRRGQASSLLQGLAVEACSEFRKQLGPNGARLWSENCTNRAESDLPRKNSLTETDRKTLVFS